LLESILDLASKIEGILWGPWTLVFIASVAVFFSMDVHAGPGAVGILILKTT